MGTLFDTGTGHRHLESLCGWWCDPFSPTRWRQRGTRGARTSPGHIWLIRWSAQFRPLTVHGGKAPSLSLRLVLNATKRDGTGITDDLDAGTPLASYLWLDHERRPERS